MYSFLEEKLDGIKTHLENNLENYTSQINTERGDSIVLGTVREWEIGYNDVYSLDRFPYGFVYAPTMTPEALTMQSDLYRDIIQIIIADKVGKRESRKTYRWSAAVANMLADDWTIGSNFDTSDIKDIAHYPPNSDGIIVTIIMIETQKERLY